MAKNLYVRVKPKGPVTTFHRCGMLFGLLWVLLTDLDPATAERLQAEQMLETSEEKPEGFDDQLQEAASGETGDQNTLTPDAESGLIGSGLLPTVIKYAGGFEIALGDLVQQVHTASGLSLADWNSLTDQARETLLQVYVDQLNQHDVSTTELINQLKEVETVRDSLQVKITAIEAELLAANEKLAKAETAAAAEAKTTAKAKAK